MTTPKPCANRSDSIERALTAAGMEWTLATIPVASVKSRRSSQVRVLDTKPDPDVVLRYGLAIEAGAKMPPIVVNQRYEIIDGVHRHEASTVARVTEIAAYVVHIDDGGDSLPVMLLAVALNQTNGRPLAPAETRAVALSALRRGASVSVIAARVGVKPGRINKWRQEEEFFERCATCNIPNVIASAAVAYQLGRIRTDRAFVHVATHAGELTEGMALTVVKDLAAARNEAAETKALERFDVAMKFARQQRATGRRKPIHIPPAIGMYKNVRAILKHSSEVLADFADKENEAELCTSWRELAVLADAVASKHGF